MQVDIITGPLEGTSGVVEVADLVKPRPRVPVTLEDGTRVVVNTDDIETTP